MEPAWLVTTGLLALGLASISFALLASRLGNPLPLIFGRWTRWLFSGLGAAYLLKLTGWLEQPFAALVVVCLLGWFLIESTYVWLAVKALSNGAVPLFPRYEAGDRSSQWPSTPRFIALRQWLRQEGFSKLAHLQSFFGDQLLAQMYIFQSSDQTLRLHILFISNYRGVVTDSCECISITRDGRRIVTDNLFLPFGGFYPENWFIERKPWTRSIQALKQRHLARLDAVSSPAQPIKEDPEDMIRKDSKTLERLNLELGFLEYAEHNEGTGIGVSPAGRYRLWLEIWTLGYFGIARRY